MRDDIDFNIRFCEEIEQFPCLYDHRRADYCNRSGQDQSWLKIAEILDTKAAECKERWKNIRGRYTKYKNQIKLPSGSGVKKVKQYYLADHLHFLDSFLKSRPSKGNIVTVLEETQEEEGNSGEENLHEETVEERDANQSPSQDANHPINDDTSRPSTPLPHVTPEPKKDSGYRKRTRSAANLSDVNSSAFKYFETKQRLLEQKQHSTSTKLDPDMAFLHSILPDMKAMDARQKRKFKMGVMQLADDTLNNTEVQSTNSVYSSSNTSSFTTFTYTSPPTDDYATQVDRVLNLNQNVDDDQTFNIQNYINVTRK